MKSNRFPYFSLLALACLTLSACAQQSGQTPAATSAPVEATTETNKQAETITLRLAVSDEEGRPSESSVLAFIEQVNVLSDGGIRIEPVWDAGADTEEGFEQGVLAAVIAGKYDMGLAASRAWEAEGITAFQPLQAPFLIDNDALAVAVATGTVATNIFEGLAGSGAAGLAIWPEDLRHPFSVVPDKPMLAPEDFALATIRTTSEGITAAMIKALGGIPEFEAGQYQGAESGLRQGSTLTGRPIASGNVVFFPKYQVLFANQAVYDQLSDAQRDILDRAAAAAQAKTIAERPSEVEAGAAWCADGGTVVLASDEQIAAFEAAVQPVFDQIEQNPLNAETIAAIRELKASTTPAPGAAACAPEVETAGNATSSDPEEWSTGLPPNGTWVVNLTLEDIERMGVLKSNAPGWAGYNSYRFDEGKGDFHGEFLDGVIIDCPYTYEEVNDFFRLTYVDLGGENYECGEQVDDLQWRLDEDGLHLHMVGIQEGLLLENTALYEAKPWQKVETWSEGPPPEGVWTVELTADDFAQAGVLQSVAQEEWAGIYTFTFEDGNSHFEWQGEQYTAKCQATYDPVDDFVRFTYYTDADECTGQIDDVRWRMDADGLHWAVVSINNAPAVELAVIYEAKPWQKVGD
jgi:C4-dicarboxylate-binding protein DctP